ncbi:MAG: hypothetical protein A3H72_02665 [Candidatus Doudnabacteria bacterium RIFCSPLOWO2_02_FULL_48_8]|uniref:SpoVT-AbrB domain-containing protein n=1 Tax=Candidatus Doudnabacteria bacterium RIFCSPHIGHO2_01_FULL_46_24 TaxID=1817825 RepID=A0A1F5NUZ9_9BACT|nr:MAG: hypothetical protein A2720_03030 [Candidatus Doudnabacteria bacterium RIFCSPHIGHO2_01_FULL_46_24]OGE95080.1 MAG: hypothetical protein A3H72_02665 [Candidatus Doudnabacteria bacterium RIFCSPLOWO2_02_FULL_48_8]OGE95756.1 MAG: hypothetical protein A3E98_02800 [Candidatus Doudnabacteria bacterium RIFCSPHIGHO2_12_FULL_48_11]
MAKAKAKKAVQHLIRLGSRSLAIVLPPSIVRSLGWKQRQRVVAKRVARGILIKDAKTKRRKK